MLFSGHLRESPSEKGLYLAGNSWHQPASCHGGKPARFVPAPLRHLCPLQQRHQKLPQAPSEKPELQPKLKNLSPKRGTLGGKIAPLREQPKTLSHPRSSPLPRRGPLFLFYYPGISLVPFGASKASRLSRPYRCLSCRLEHKP